MTRRPVRPSEAELLARVQSVLDRTCCQYPDAFTLCWSVYNNDQRREWCLHCRIRWALGEEPQ